MNKLFSTGTGWIRSKFVLGAALVAMLLAAGSTAQAAEDALVQFRSFSFLAGFGFPYGVGTQGCCAGTYYHPGNKPNGKSVHSNATVTVTNTTTATPGVSWAAGQWTGSNMGVYGPYTYFNYPTLISYRSGMFNMPSGMLSKSHAGAVTGTVVNSQVATNTCVEPGNCYASHFGTMMNTPNAKKYGGTARLIRTGGAGPFTINSIYYPFGFLLTTQYGGYSSGSFSVMDGTSTPVKSLAKPRGFANRQNTNMTAFPEPLYNTLVEKFGAAYTTGVITGMVSIPATTTSTTSGSNNLNAANLTGTISVVVPKLSSSHFTCRDFFDTPASGGGVQTSGSPDGVCDWDGLSAVTLEGVDNLGTGPGYRSIQLTFFGFAPEPGTVAMLGSGILALAGVARLRRRS